MYKVEYKKKLIASLGISLFLLITFIFPFFIHMNQKQSLAYYPLTEMVTEEATSTVSISGYEKDKERFKVVGDEPFLHLYASKLFNKVDVFMSEKQSEPLRIQVFYSNSDVFFEEQSVSYTLESGERSAAISLGDFYSNVRIKISSTQGSEFNLAKIALSDVGVPVMVCIQSLLAGVVVFVLCSVLSKKPRVSKIIEKIRRKRLIQSNMTLIQGLLLMTFLFSILYFKYIYLGEAYVFSNGDICGDTLDGLYPSYHMFSEMLHEGNLSMYSLQSGFGANYINIVAMLFQPFNLVTILFPADKIEIGIIVGVYIRMSFIMIFAIKYFIQVFKDNKTSIICALLWTFCSYIIIWGQQYGYGSNMVYFTAFSYYFHKLCANKKINMGLIVTLIFISFSGYYFFYSIGVYAMLYLGIFSLIHKITLKEIVYIILKLAGVTIVAIGLTACILLPNIFIFLNSARTGTFSNISTGLLNFVDIQTIVSMVGRFMSPNLLGTALDGAQYAITNTGLNYYEMAFLSVGIVSLFAINYYISTNKTKRAFIIIVMIVLGFSLMTYIVSYAITFGYNFRWTFMLLFLQILLIGNFIKFILYNYDQKIALKVSVRSTIVYGVLSLILVAADKYNIVNLNYKILCILWVFIILYAILTSSKKWKPVCIVVIIAEIVFQSYAPISMRGTEKIADLQQKYYYDGTIESVEKIKNNDSSIYRINKTYLSRFYNDAQVQGYNGMSVYNSLNSKNLQELLNEYGVKESYYHPNYFKVSADDLLLNGLFGAKYIISDQPIDTMTTLYDEEYPVYENPYYLPFGFLYNQQIDVSNVDSKDMAEYAYLGYYDETKEGELLEEVLSNDVYGEFTKLNDVEVLMNLQLGTVSNYNSILATYEAKKNSITTAYISIGGQLEKQFRFTTYEGENEVKFDLPYMENVEDVEMKMVFGTGDVGLSQVAYMFKSYDQNKLLSLISEYKKQALESVEYEGDYIRGKITNHDNLNKMLFIPIVYSDEWTVYVDGEKREIKEINGGFIGTMIEPGQHNIELEFKPQGFTWGCKISLFTIVCVVTWKCKDLLNRKNKLKN